MVLLLKPDLKKEARDKMFVEIKKWLGEISDDKVESLGERKLAYPIKHERRGEFSVLAFTAATIDADLNKKLLIRDEILRHLLIKN